MEITLDDLKRRLPDPDDFKATDEYYLTLAKYIDKLWVSMKVFPEINEEIHKSVVVSLVSYYQDVIADAGLWRAFVMMCRKLYRRPVPFYEEPDDYIDYELNQIDVQFIVWYSLESQLGFNGLVSPYDPDLLRFSRQVYKLFDFLYDDAPEPENFKQLMELDLDDRNQVREIFKMSGWLFWNSYFLRPVSKYAYEPDISEDDELTIDETLTDERRLRITFERPTGPLALLVDEWLRLIIDSRFPKEKRRSEAQETHKYYKALKRAAGGKEIAFFATYGDLDDFLVGRLGWNRQEEGIFPQMKDFSDFVVFATPEKGMMIVHDVACYIKHPDNPLYDAEKSAAEAYRLLMEPAVCPVDLLRYLFEKGLVPDAAYPSGKDAKKLLHDNWDFIARMYLRDFYRGD